MGQEPNSSYLDQPCQRGSEARIASNCPSQTPKNARAGRALEYLKYLICSLHHPSSHSLNPLWDQREALEHHNSIVLTRMVFTLCSYYVPAQGSRLHMKCMPLTEHPCSGLRNSPGPPYSHVKCAKGLQVATQDPSQPNQCTSKRLPQGSRPTAAELPLPLTTRGRASVLPGCADLAPSFSWEESHGTLRRTAITSNVSHNPCLVELTASSLNFEE